jgi:methylmalonyl-CoA mutase N-terminal domain/subunit
LRTQQILAEETGVTNTIDPLAGSYFVEALTNRIEGETLEYIQKIDDLGGMVAAIEKGYPQAEIAEAAYQHQRLVDEGKKVAVGVNKHVTDHPPITTWKMDPEIERRQLKRLREVKEMRNGKKVNELLKKLRGAAEGDENLMPYIIGAVREYATLQEICDVFRDVFGTYTDPGFL